MPFDIELEQFVGKMEKSDTPMLKADLYATMKKFANRQRLPQESEQQAFVKFVERDPYGKVLFRKYNATKGVSVPVAKVATGHNAGAEGDPKRQTGNDADGDDNSGETEHMRTLRQIASAIQVRHPELRLTKSSALTLAIQTTEGRELYRLDKQARLRVA